MHRNAGHCSSVLHFQLVSSRVLLCCRYDEARALLRQGTSIEAMDSEGNTGLMLACRAGHGRLVKLLLRKGARHDASNAQGKTALHLALDNAHGSIAHFLTKLGVGPTAV